MKPKQHVRVNRPPAIRGGIPPGHAALDRPHPGYRPPCRRQRARTADHDGPDPAAARRPARRHLSAGAQIRARHQSRLGRPPLRGRAGVQRAGRAISSTGCRTNASARQPARAHVPRTGPQFRPYPERAAPGGAEPARPRPRQPNSAPAGAAQNRKPMRPPTSLMLWLYLARSAIRDVVEISRNLPGRVDLGSPARTTRGTGCATRGSCGRRCSSGSCRC